jgi:hypothetical protein
VERGYFALYRKIREHPFYKEKRIYSKFEAWLDLLLEAQYTEQPRDVMFGMIAIKQNYGECLKSIRTWGTRWGWSESKVQRFLKLLKKLGQIEQKSEGITTRITICNYELYNPRRHTDGTRPTQDRHRTDTGAVTKEERNKGNKEIKDKSSAIFPEWIDKDLWKEFKKYRTKIKSPLTEHAEKLCLADLVKLVDDGEDQIEVINQTIKSGKWKSFYAVKRNFGNYQESLEEWTKRVSQT